MSEIRYLYLVPNFNLYFVHTKLTYAFFVFRSKLKFSLIFNTFEKKYI